jgi:hypothetical protein
MNSAKFFAPSIAACAVLAVATPALAQQNAAFQASLDPAAAAQALAGASHRFVSSMARNNPAAAMGKIRTDLTAGALPQAAAAGNGSHRYPADLIFNGGNTIPSAVHHAVYLIPNGSVCTTPACWGNVAQFLSDLNRSDFIHVTDQYVGTQGGHRYPYEEDHLTLHYGAVVTPAFTDSQMASLAIVLASAFGSGYGHIYHIFLAPEQNECFDSSFTICSSNIFCAYHSSVVTAGGTEVVYTVEPYQLFPGCSVKPGTPNGAFDATYNVLSHEVFETITDPDGTAWWNSVDNGIFGEEIGDECSFITFAFAPNVYFDPSTVTLGEHQYATQPEYSNAGHVCTVRSPGD